MRHNFFNHNIAALVLIVLLIPGCGANDQLLPKTRDLSDQERSFAGALQYLKSGKEQQARELLEKVVAASTVNGITDEALFRLALLNVRDEGGKGPVRTQSLLERLENEFPRSIWTYQAAPLMSYLASIRLPRSKQRELKNLRELNLSLSRDNRELRQTLERLKSLDIELDQKIRR